MATYTYDLRRVNHITAGAVGAPGQRVFYLQAQKHGDLVSLITEKEYVRALCQRVDAIIEELERRGTERPSQADEPTPAELMLRGPLQALFRIAQLGLAFDPENDLFVLEAEELILPDDDDDEEIDPILKAEEAEPAEPRRVRFSATRAQMQGLSRFAMDIITTGGRPQCPQCLQPMDPEGHLCVKKNGFANKTADH